MSADLYPFQAEGVEFLADRDVALLADEMGLGKTPQAIVAARRAGAKKVLVVCPAILRPQWKREIDKFSSNDFGLTLVVTSRKDANKADLEFADWVVISYDLTTSPMVHDALCDAGFDLLICDEAHFLKNRKAQRTKAVLGLTGHRTKTSLAGQIGKVWFLTGTPAPNDILDMFPYFKAAGLYDKSYSAFENEFTDGYRVGPGDDYVVTRQKNLPTIHKMTKALMLRRLKAEVFRDIPPLTINNLSIEAKETPIAGPSVLRRLPEIDRELTEKFEEMRQKGTLAKPDTAMSSLRREVGMLKVLSVCQLIDNELSSGPGKIVVFGIHTVVLKYIRAYLAKYRAKMLYGGTPTIRRQQVVDAFQTMPSCRVLVCQMAVASTGLNLTAADSVWIAEPSWVPADNAQAIARCHRIGQERPVAARFISLSGTIDERVNDVLVRKTRMIGEIHE